MRHTLALNLGLALVLIACNDQAKPSAAPPKKESAALPFRVPQESEVKDSATLVSIRRGRALIHSTRDSLPKFVGSALNCSNCHFADGTIANAMPMVGSYTR